ncbi:MAG: helix-turn-helix domain-containing protein [Oscillibacter sp.]|jgi:transcriptional regulator with XRE-family HTH domain|nr:helix-turn-helix domain-containing protein [Oscillibacter sp.]
MSVGETIKAAREALGMTQEELAEKLEVSRQAVSKWEVGASVPSPENLELLENVLGVVFSTEKESCEKKGRPLYWKVVWIVLGILLLSAFLSIGVYLAIKGEGSQDVPVLTGVYWFAEDGKPLYPDLGDGWCLFEAGSKVLLVTDFQNGEEIEVYAAAVYLTPAGTETFDEREQLAVQGIPDGQEFALFVLDIPEGLMGHLEIMLECSGGKAVGEVVNITSIS